jgi:hypothetical protein
MEPIGYMLSLTYSLLAYFYFLVTRGNYFDYGPFEEYWTQQQLVRKRLHLPCLHTFVLHTTCVK